ncbi:MAG: prenyltransferase/squalene oxidase repeat-containing protein, partial [Acidobacteriota bacterium]
AGFLGSFGGGQELDLVHLSCLARCWSALPGAEPASENRAAMLERLADFRVAGQGYGNEVGDTAGNVYGCFMALGTCQDLGASLPEAEEVAAFVESMRTEDGGYANDTDMAVGTLPVTAAAVTLLRNLGRPVAPETERWLARQRHASGGFLATPDVPMPDLLSTATALHALAGLQHPFDDLVEPCLDYIDTLWTNRGGFHGHWADDDLDCEYTFYGLLALGHLSIWTR